MEENSTKLLLVTANVGSLFEEVSSDFRSFKFCFDFVVRTKRQ